MSKEPEQLELFPLTGAAIRAAARELEARRELGNKVVDGLKKAGFTQAVNLSGPAPNRNLADPRVSDEEYEAEMTRRLAYKGAETLNDLVAKSNEIKEQSRDASNQSAETGGPIYDDTVAIESLNTAEIHNVAKVSRFDRNTKAVRNFPDLEEL